PNEGYDWVESSVSYTLADNVEELALVGTGDLDATGNALKNVLFGNDGNNVLDGGTNTDTMIGGAGNDTYIVERSTDLVVEYLDQGLDTVESSVSYTLTSDVEVLVLTGAAATHGTGNELENNLFGNTGSNVLDGGIG